MTKKQKKSNKAAAVAAAVSQRAGQPQSSTSTSGGGGGGSKKRPSRHASYPSATPSFPPHVVDVCKPPKYGKPTTEIIAVHK
mmetsp:Transcript_35094/g.76823  ORF Transcript_35094/g.76823 Transcript_35094/m.76823 type:complete len:82 (+) Transcript_35094:59-304(+)